MKYNDIVTQVSIRSGLGDRAEAERATLATLETLGDRLAGNEPIDLAAQLPTLLQDLVARRDGLAEKYGRDEFVRRVAERTATTFDEAENLARSVFRTVAESVSDAEMDDLRSQLPDDYASLLN